MATRTWFIEIGFGEAESPLIYLVRLNDQEFKSLSDELMELARNGKIQTYKMDPADRIAISIEDVRRRLGLVR